MVKYYIVQNPHNKAIYEKLEKVRKPSFPFSNPSFSAITQIHFLRKCICKIGRGYCLRNQAMSFFSFYRRFLINLYSILISCSVMSKYTVTFSNWRQQNISSTELEYITKEFRPFANFDESSGHARDWMGSLIFNQEEQLESLRFKLFFIHSFWIPYYFTDQIFLLNYLY